MKKFIHILFFLIITALPALAQEAAAPVEMATGLRSSGKIYIVVGVLIIIFAGIVVYLVRLDNRVSRLEKEKE